MTSISIQSSLSGLKAAQRALDTISTNIANASTAGYTRKILPQETLILQGTGIGVNSLSLTRTVNKALLSDLHKQTSVRQQAMIREQYLVRVQEFHGASDAERALSSRISAVADAFTSLSSSPSDTILQGKVMNYAQDLVDHFHSYADMLQTLRNETETEIQGNVSQVNNLLKKVADLNKRIAVLTTSNQTSADLEDQRDIAIRTISNYMQVSTFTTGDNQIVVMSRQGQTLADTTAHKLVFENNFAIPASYYPGGGLSGVFIDSLSGIEIKSDFIGGNIGGLLDMRDNTLPAYQAQLDEMAQKLSERFDTQELRLFTDMNGDVPASVAPPAAVSYVGYANTIQLNPDIVSDRSLLQKGTHGENILTGSNEVINRINEFAFGAFAYEEIVGTTDISAGTLFASSGLTQFNQVIGNIDLTDYVPDLSAANNIAPPADFTLDIGGAPYLITINPGDTASDLVNNINAAVGSDVADLNGLGQLRITTNADVTFTDSTLGVAGMADLGFTFGVTPAKNPAFTVQVGTQSALTVAISPTDTATDILATLNAMDGIQASLGGNGELIITPEYGGRVTIKNVIGNPIAALGLSTNSVAHTTFRQDNLGPNGDISTGLLANSTLEDFARSIISSTAEDHSLAKDRAEQEDTFYNTLDKRNADTSGVNLDEELSELIRVQTAYSAAAKMISASERLLDDLFAVF